MPILFQEKPYAASIQQHLWGGKLCFGCYKEIPSLDACKQCSGCHNAWYCDETCQKYDWKVGHNRECEVFRKCKSKLVWDEIKQDTGLRCVMRAVARRYLDGGVPDDDDILGQFPGDLKPRTLEDLLKRKSTLKGRNRVNFEISKKLYARTYMQVSEFYKRVPLKDVDEVFAAFYTNAHAINDILPFDFYVPSKGIAIYLQVSRFNHSCDPDLVVYTPRSNLAIVKTVRDVEDKKFNDLTISYIQWQMPAKTMTTKERRKIIEAQQGFKCQCKICKDKKADLLKQWAVTNTCPQCQEALVVKPSYAKKPEKVNRGYCVECAKYVPIPFMRFKEIMYVYDLYRKDKEGMNSAITPAVQMLWHPTKNIKMLEIRLNSQSFIEAETALNSYEQFDEHGPGYAIACSKLAKIYENAEEFEDAKRLYKKAQDSWGSYLTKDHNCCRMLEEIVKKIELKKKRILLEQHKEKKEIKEKARERGEEVETDNEEQQLREMINKPISLKPRATAAEKKETREKRKAIRDKRKTLRDAQMMAEYSVGPNMNS